MTKYKQLAFITLLVLLFFGCKDDKLTGIYAPPSWLPGKLYSQIQSKPELTTFAELVKISGYDTIINVSGSFTVFAPSNDAFTQYFQSNPNYKKVSDIPKAEAVKLVKYHIVQDGWSKQQLMSLDVNGWIDSTDLKNNLPKGYKRQTLLMEKNRKYGVKWSKYIANNQSSSFGVLKRQDIIDTTATTWYRRVITDSRKYAPIFYKQYFDIYNLKKSDFEFYFGRPFLSDNDIYYCGGRITSPELFAENGFVYVIDQVIEPLKNGVEFLTDNSKNNYSTFYNLLNMFSEFNYNQDATSKQPGYALGFRVDTLYNLTYPKLVFDINSELTKAPRGTFGLPGNVSIRYHQGILAPTNEAMDQLVSQYIAGGNNWGSIENAPENIKKIIVNSCLSINPVYPTDVSKGILNGESDNIVIDESSIVQKEYGSSCTFIGVNKPIVPRAFSSVTGPVYLRKGFSKVMYAIEASGLLPALKKQDAKHSVNYSLYVESDNSSASDSTLLMMNNFSGKQTFFLSTMYPAVRRYPLSSTDIRTLILNHVATGQPKGVARKEFVKNLAGNYLIFDNVNHVVQGTSPSTFGYNGARQVLNHPRQISTNSDNGYTYEIDSWFNFSNNSVFNTLLIQFPKFHALIKRAGLSNDALGIYKFMSPTVNYTVFAPSDSILNTMSTFTNAMSQVDLQKFVMMHFISGQILFTDGNMTSRYYETCRVDEKSTSFVPVNTKIKIVAGIDKITIASVDGTNDVIVNESPRTNLIMSQRIITVSTGTPVVDTYVNCFANGVVHEIKKPLLFGQIDTQ